MPGSMQAYRYLQYVCVGVCSRSYMYIIHSIQCSYDESPMCWWCSTALD